MSKMNIKRPVGQLPKPEGYPDFLDEAGLAEHVIGATPGYADEEFIMEFFRGANARLTYVPLNEIKPGPADNNIRIQDREKKYAKLPPTTMPPIVLEHGSIQDGHHRWRTAKTLGLSGLWCYVIEDSGAFE